MNLTTHTPASLEAELNQCIGSHREPTPETQTLVLYYQHLLGANNETAALLRLLNAIAVVTAAELEDE